VLMFQSGPFLTVTAPGATPRAPASASGWKRRADIFSGADPYMANATTAALLNSAAFRIPANNIGRHPTSP